MTLKCFQVWGCDDDPETTEIIFAKSDIAARKQWANEHADGEIDGLTAKHHSEWDQYAPGPVPVLVLLEAGWWFECYGCNRKISEDRIGTPLGLHEDDWEDGWPDGEHWQGSMMDPIEPRSGLYFCCPQCHRDYVVEAERKARLKRRAMAVMSAFLVRKYPGVEVGQCGVNLGGQDEISNGRMLVSEAWASFTFPGQTSPYHSSLHVSDQRWRWHEKIEVHGPLKHWQALRDCVRQPMRAKRRKWSLSIQIADIPAWEKFAGKGAIAFVLER